MGTTVDDLIDLKDMAVALAYSVRAALADRAVPLAQLSDLHSRAESVVERAELYDAAEESDAVSIEDYEENHAEPVDRCEACDAERGDGYCQECPNDPDRPEKP